MEAALQAAEARLRSAEAALADPATYSAQPTRIREYKAELLSASTEIETLYARWQELQSLLDAR